MKVRELRLILDGCHPEETVVLMSDQSHRLMQILSVNQQASLDNGALVLNADWAIKDKVEEKPIDRLKRERDKMTAEINKLSASERQRLAKKVHKNSKSKRSRTTQMIADCLDEVNKANPPVKRGRPRKNPVE